MRCGTFDKMELTAVIKAHPEYLGERHKGETTLPILVKLIDARKDLSVQVHPDDDYAKMKEHGQLGKTEMWYVLDAARDAKLIYGLRQDCTKKEMKKALAEGTVMKYLQKVPIHKDDLFFIPAGTIHAIGAGALVAEIQESSNLTYRLYDYDRIGKDGKKRELHINKALDVADLHGSAEPRQPLRVLKYRPGMASELLIRCKYFEVYGYCLNTLHSYEFDGSAGFARMQSIMQAFRGGIKEFGGKKVVRLLDYVQGLDGLPKSDVLKFLLEDNCSLVVRPSGTEPKLKIYISVSAENKEMAEEVEDEIAKTAEKWIC